MAGPHELERRDFVKVVVAVLGTVMAGTIAIPAIGYVIDPATKISQADAWIPVGPVTNFPPEMPTLVTFTRTRENGWERTVNSYGVYVLNEGNSTFLALSNICTHLSCRVSWKDDQGEYLCPCHAGIFNKMGQVVSGPPPKPLYAYETKTENDVLYIHYVEGSA